MTDELYGPIVLRTDFEAAVIDHLKLWLPDYLAVIGRRKGTGTPPLPRSWDQQSEFDKFPEDQLPKLAVICSGTVDTPKQEGQGLFRVNWNLSIANIVSANTMKNTRILAAMYGAAVAMVMEQHPAIALQEGEVESVDWRGDSSDDVVFQDSRSLAAAVNLYRIEVRGVLSSDGGLAEPSGEPETDSGDWPTVLTTDLEVEPKEP